MVTTQMVTTSLSSRDFPAPLADNQQNARSFWVSG